MHISRFVLMRVVDWTAVLLFACEAVFFPFSQYCANSLDTFGEVALSIVTYLSVRLFVHKRWHSASISGLLGLGGAWLSLMGIYQFFTGTSRLRESGFHDFVAFRSSLMHPLPGWIPGECFTAILLTLPFAFGLVAYLWRRGSGDGKIPASIALLPLLIIASALFLSLSRAVFWSVVLFVFAACGLMMAYRIVTPKLGSLLLGSSIVTLVVILACASALYPGIFKAYLGSHTSQVRSTKGRVEIWNHSVKLTHEHRWLGVGSSNAALFLLSTADQDDTTGFASRPFSLPVQVLLEKGSVGFALYAAFLLLVGIEFHRSVRSGTLAGNDNRHFSKKAIRDREQLERKASAFKAMKCGFAAGLIAVLFRELTYSSLFDHTLTLVLTFLLAALAITRERVTPSASE